MDSYIVTVKIWDIGTSSRTFGDFTTDTETFDNEHSARFHADFMVEMYNQSIKEGKKIQFIVTLERVQSYTEIIGKGVF